MALSNSYATLLTSPSHFRTYNLAMARLTLQRDADLRQSALLHAYKLESARQQFDNGSAKCREEARIAKKNVREKLLAIVEDRRKRLKEEKEGGELAMGELIRNGDHTCLRLLTTASLFFRNAH
jgi:Sds3-like